MYVTFISSLWPLAKSCADDDHFHYTKKFKKQNNRLEVSTNGLHVPWFNTSFLFDFVVQ
jgi:hypothetical protein